MSQESLPTNGHNFAATLRSGAPYIHAHRGRIFVIHIPGEAFASAEFDQLIYDIALLHSLGVKLVLAFGARPQIKQILAQNEITAPIVNDMRVTPPAAIPFIKQAVGSLLLDLQARLSTGLMTTPMAGAQVHAVTGNLITAKPLGIVDGTNHAQTGTVRRIDTQSILTHMQHHQIVLLPCVGYSPSGETFNLFAEEVANFAASALNANKLVLLHAGPALHQKLSFIPRQLRPKSTQALIQQHGTSLEHDDLALLKAAQMACQNGVDRAHIVSFATSGALLTELYSRDGDGVLIAADHYDQIRSAQPNDLGGLLNLIKPLERAGALVPRSREQLELDLAHYLVMVRDHLVIACCALIAYPQENMGELACVAVHVDYQNAGRATQLLAEAEARAKQQDLDRLFILTTRASHWFIEHGFSQGSISDLPMGKQKLYNYQRNSEIYIKLL